MGFGFSKFGVLTGGMMNSREILNLLRSAAGTAGVLDYGTFTNIALHHPEFGYYRQNRRRVGKVAGADFYTAASHGALFGKLVRAAATKIFGEAFCRRCTLVEIGAEPEQSLFAGESRFFKNTLTLRAGDALALPENSIVFSNELLDAQPFGRLIFKDGAWRELGVNVAGESLFECVLGEKSSFRDNALGDFTATLPVPWREGWIVDAPLGAEKLLREITEQPGCAGVIFFDYGKTLAECLQTSPEGTARAYFRHRQHNDLLALPGQQDLTCHVLWDRLEAVLRAGGFSDVRVDRQEAFFMRNAGAEIAAALESPDSGLEHERSCLRELLHPAHFGHKFQVLYARK